MSLKLVIPLVAVMCFVYCIIGSSGVYISNLSEACYHCLCHVTTKCNMSYGCKESYCGPFSISRVYWADAGKVTLPEDDPNRDLSWKDCANTYQCAKRIVEGYMQKFGTDCNGDGVTNCFDYMMINANGGYGCTEPLHLTDYGLSSSCGSTEITSGAYINPKLGPSWANSVPNDADIPYKEDFFTGTVRRDHIPRTPVCGRRVFSTRHYFTEMLLFRRKRTYCLRQ